MKEFLKIIIGLPINIRIYLLNTFCFEILWKLCSEKESNPQKILFPEFEKRTYEIEQSVVGFADNFIEGLQCLEIIEKYNNIMDYLYKEIEKKGKNKEYGDSLISYQLFSTVDARIRYLDGDIYRLSKLDSLKKIRLDTSYISAITEARVEIYNDEEIFKKVCDLNSLKPSMRSTFLEDGLPFVVEEGAEFKERVIKEIEKNSKGKLKEEKMEEVEIAGVRWVEEKGSILKCLMAKLTLNYLLSRKGEDTIFFRRLSENFTLELIAYVMGINNKI